MNEIARTLAACLLLFASAAVATETDVSLREYLENRIEELDRRNAQEALSTRVAIEAALQNEIRRQDQERNARFALKTEVIELRERIVNLEGSNSTTFIGMIVIALLMVINLVKPFWRQ